MKINKIYKLCISVTVFLSSIVLPMMLLKIPAVSNLFNPENIYSISGS